MFSLLFGLCLQDLSPLPQRPKILFLGNSHTSQHNIPRTVKRLLESDGSGRKAKIELVFAATTNDHWANRSTVSKIKNGNWSAVVIQGQPLSRSRKYFYSQEGAVGLANLASEAGSIPVLFIEWARRGIDESDYIQKVYGQVLSQTKARTAPAVDLFPLILRTAPKAQLWASDGNHSGKDGALGAACLIYLALLGDETPKQMPKELLRQKFGKEIFAAAKEVQKKDNEEVARSRGFEPPTPSSASWCSIR